MPPTTMPPAVFLEELHRRRVTVTIDGDRLRAFGPASALTPAVGDYLLRHKPELLGLLRREHEDVGPGSPSVAPEEAQRPQHPPAPETALTGGSDAIANPFDGMTEREYLEPYRDLICAALDGELPGGPVPVAGVGVVTDPAAATLAAGRELLRLVRAGQPTRTRGRGLPAGAIRAVGVVGRRTCALRLVVRGSRRTGTAAQVVRVKAPGFVAPARQSRPPNRRALKIRCFGAGFSLTGGVQLPGSLQDL